MYIHALVHSPITYTFLCAVFQAFTPSRYSHHSRGNAHPGRDEEDGPSNLSTLRRFRGANQGRHGTGPYRFLGVRIDSQDWKEGKGPQ